ncbi:DUF4214 domain-containing protein [Aquabacterium sp.]|uniref:DUF4214 domain-containing protein n=1 Tax=Aquabacterium sp. TaxID=1872578 RepID=UPI002BA061E3|nr:DUF4214 domain-containing protein [Aquabacterium sp.]HSW04264.1 DUF4214 domain-containing protein [Aquabacterium sp.]
MTTWTLFKPLDISSFDFLSLGDDAVADVMTSDHYRESAGRFTLDIFGDGLHYNHGELLPLGDIFGIDLFESLDEALQIVDVVWSLLKILSYYNPLTDHWDLEGLHDYLFREADWFDGSEGDDWFAGRGGDDVLQGGGGIDVAAYSGARSDFTLSRTAEAWQLADTRGSEGTDTLAGVERLQFQDSSLALDLAGHAGTVARLIGAVFGPQFLAHADLVGVGLALLDEGMSTVQLSALATGSDLFEALAGSHSNADFVRTVYRNVTGTEADDSTRDYYVALLDSGTMTQAALAAVAAETEINAEQIDLIGLAQTGIAFTPAD